MSTIPDEYQKAGYRTVYGDEEAKLAIALREIQGSTTGGGGGGGGATAAEIQTAVKNALVDVQDNQSFASDILQSITSLLTDSIQFLLIGIASNLATITNKIPNLGSNVKNDSMSVTVALDDAAIGTDITGTTIPTGGSGIRGLLSWIAKLISDRLPSALVGDRLRTQSVLDNTTITGSSAVLSGTVIPSTDLSNYASIYLLISGSFTATIVFQFSEDETNWSAGYLYALNSIGVPVNSTNSLSSFYGNKQGKFFRALINTYTSGTVSGILHLSSCPTTSAYPSVSILGTVAVDSELPAAIALGDAISLSASPSVITGNYLFNGGTWDRARTSGSGRALVDGSGVTQPVSASSLPLPTLAATSTLQTTGNTSLSNIDTKIPALVGGRLQTQTVLDSTTVTGSTSAPNGLVIASTDCSNYGSLSLQLTGTWVGSVVFEISNDNTNWGRIYLFTANSFSTESANSNNIYCGNKTARYFRARCLSYASGTIVGTLSLFTPSTSPAYPITTISDRLMPAGSNSNLYSSLGSVVSANIKTLAGSVYALYCVNTNASIRYIQLFNSTTAPANAAVPIISFPIPPNNGLLLLGQDVLGGEGLNFSAGISFGLSSTLLIYTATLASDAEIIIRYA